MLEFTTFKKKNCASRHLNIEWLFCHSLQPRGYLFVLCYLLSSATKFAFRGPAAAGRRAINFSLAHSSFLKSENTTIPQCQPIFAFTTNLLSFCCSKFAWLKKNRQPSHPRIKICWKAMGQVPIMLIRSISFTQAMGQRKVGNIPLICFMCAN